MTFQTVQVGIAPANAIDIIKAHDKRGEAWSFVGVDSPHPSRQRMQLWVDGCDMPTEITLNSDGTWTATTHVVIGEKE